MSKKAIHWILTLMSISLLGIIAFQVYWIWLSVEQKAAEFDRDVYQALAEVRKKVERQEAFVFIDQLSEAKNQSKVDSSVNWKSENKFEVITNIEIEENDDSLIRSIKEKVRVLKSPDLKDGMMVIGDETEAVTMINLNDSSNQKVKLIKRFKEKKSKLSKAINELAFEFAFKQSDLKERLQGINIDSIIKVSLSEQGLTNANYQYAIYANSSDSLIQGVNINDKKSLYQQKLFKAESAQNSGLLTLGIDNKTAYVLNALWVMLAISLLLTAVMIYTFSFTVYAIFRQKKISEIKSDFINNMTHEFKTPIATISLAIDSILHPKVKKDEKEIDRYGAIIKKENHRMNQQVERLLQMAMFEKQELELQNQKIDVHAHLKEVVEAFILATKAENSQLELDLNAESYHVVADSMHLYNSIRNIIDNAIKFSNKPFQVKITTSNTKDHLEIKISDRGIGMSTNTQKRIFDRFYRLSQGDIHQTKGFGLGLAYVKEVIEKMQGTIEVKSKLGVGSTFSIILPLTK